LSSFFICSSFHAVGFAPRVVLGVKATGSSGSAWKQLELRPRVTVGSHVAPRLRLHGIATLGYSVMFDLPSDANGNSSHPHGFIVGFGGGLAYTLNPHLLVTGEITYQLGFQTAHVMGNSYDFRDDYLTLGIGLLGALG